LIIVSQYCYLGETVRLSFVRGIKTPDIGKFWDRYSNTLLVSLNNRISIRERREGTSVRGALPAFQTPAALTSGVPSSIVHVELEKSPHTFKEREQSGEDEGQERVIGG
jgi:hypothetical protein